MDFPAGAAAEPAAATAHGHYAGAQGWTVGHAAPAAHQRRTGGQLDGGGLRPWGSSCRTLASNWPSLLALETHGLYPSKWLDPHHVSSLPQCHVPCSWAKTPLPVTSTQSACSTPSSSSPMTLPLRVYITGCTVNTCKSFVLGWRWIRSLGTELRWTTDRQARTQQLVKAS